MPEPGARRPLPPRVGIVLRATLRAARSLGWRGFLIVLAAALLVQVPLYFQYRDRPRAIWDYVGFGGGELGPMYAINTNLMPLILTAAVGIWMVRRGDLFGNPKPGTYPIVLARLVLLSLLLVGIPTLLVVGAGLVAGAIGGQTPGAIAAVILGIFAVVVWVRTAAAWGMVLTDQRSAVSAMKKSWSLTRGRSWRWARVFLATTVLLVLGVVLLTVASGLVIDLLFHNGAEAGGLVATLTLWEAPMLVLISVGGAALYLGVAEVAVRGSEPGQAEWFVSGTSQWLDRLVYLCAAVVGVAIVIHLVLLAAKPMGDDSPLWIMALIGLGAGVGLLLVCLAVFARGWRSAPLPRVLVIASLLVGLAYVALTAGFLGTAIVVILSNPDCAGLETSLSEPWSACDDAIVDALAWLDRLVGL